MMQKSVKLIWLSQRKMYLLNVYLFLFADLMHCVHLCVVTGIDAQAYSCNVMLNLK